jgi:hypothetical protein
LWVFFFLVLLSGCIQNSLENLNDFFQYTFITKIEYVNEYPMTLPAFTVCLLSLNTNFTLDMSLYNCSISSTECDIHNFYSYKALTSYNDEIVTCYVLNGGKNSTDHPSEIKSTTTTGFFSGFFMELYLPKDHSIYYYINDAYVKPTKSEIAKYLTSGKISDIILEKTVETKLEYPFNNCWNRVNLPDTPLVRQLSADNITYRQVNCLEVCFQKVVQKYALEHGINEDEARESKKVINYDTEKNCNHLCPLECESTQYKISQSTFSIVDLNIEDKRLKNISFIEKKLNITINSTEEFNKNKLQLNVNFESLKYTQISQTPKTSLSALISNLGGSTGLFLDLSFMSACRAIEFFLGIIFKF